MKTVSWYLHSLIGFDFETITIITKEITKTYGCGRSQVLSDYGHCKVHTSVMSNNTLVLYVM